MSLLRHVSARPWGGLVIAAGVALCVPGCALNSSEPEGSAASMALEEAPPPPRSPEPMEAAGAVDGLLDMEADDAPARDQGMIGGLAKAERPNAKRGAAFAAVADRSEDKNNEGRSGGEAAPATRAWFPETMLFEPLVVTDDSGRALASVRVPDRLTGWRVLGLAHSRNGAQAGAVTSFQSALPAYVEPVVPAQMYVGDQVRVPISLINTTATALTTSLAVTAEGGQVALGGGPVTVAGNAGEVRYATLSADRPGRLRLTARLGDADAITRDIPVLPTAMPVTQEQRGTLAAPRRFELSAPARRVSPTAELRVVAFPGALAILRTELGAAGGRQGPAEAAFALLVAAKAGPLLAALGESPGQGPQAQADAQAVRALTLVATQRAARHARTLNVATATVLADAAAAHPDSPVLARLGARALTFLRAEQRPDGTCGGAGGWTLQRLLVATAECARAASSAPEVGIRAAGAFERHAARIEDAYTAAAVLASGAIGPARAPELAARLRGLVVDAIEDTPDGAQVVSVPAGVVRSDGRPPSKVEATALAILALGDQLAPERRAALGAAVLAGYRPGWGWGDGRASLTAMQAVLEMFRDPLPDQVTVTVSQGGVEVASGTLSRERVRENLILEATVDGGARQSWEVRAEPPVPGLGFSFELTHRVPWPTPSDEGLVLAVTPPEQMTVGRPAALQVSAQVPGGQPFHIALALPAGVQVEPSELERLVAEGTLTRHRIADDRVELWAGALPPAQLFGATLRVIPTFSGRLSSGAHQLDLTRAGADPASRVYAPPAQWIVGQ
ncbi:alpha-2-macroglobulin family protein [Haliangium sp.]|uniref:alpha-2-macroglobulin family protein n=1 Tax=Haliangium sp. TaxID=2663208 RepID=UPI003D104524